MQGEAWTEGGAEELGEGLNPPQREAVLHEGGPLVVFAGAGSGKTRVIVHRVAHLVAEAGLAPWQVLAVTFTNKAAQEMRERLARMLEPGDARDVWVGTFHATCARLLRRYGAALGVRRDFTVYDDADQRAMVTRVLRDLGLDEKRYQPRMVAGTINKAKQEVQGPAQMTLRRAYDEVVQRVYVAYEERMAAAGALDFGDLITKMVVGLETDEALRGEVGGRFRHVLVDEFQDTNHAQYRLVRALAADGLTVVGDDDQSIYRWRGADRRNILDFTRDYPSARVIKLERNYRSTQRILRAANGIIRVNVDREPKTLWTENEEGAKVTVLTCVDEQEEARLLVEAARELQRGGRSLEDIALFYRIHAQSRVFEDVLRAARVPYRIVGGLRFYDRAEIKDMLAYLRVLSNPRDDVSLLRILNTPPRGIGKKTVEGVLDRAAAEGRGVYAALTGAATGRGAAAKRLGAFQELIEGLTREAERGVALSELAKTVFEESGYGRWLVEQDSPEAQARIENIGELVGALEEREAATPGLTLPAFLESVTLDSASDAEGGDEQAEERLTLMTVHAAKGLEFPVVLVAGLEERMFPYRGVAEEEDLDDLEEERRLAYVALTRAQQRLILSWARTRRIFGRLRPNERSRFLDEIPRDDVEEIGAGRTTAPSRSPARRSAPSPSPRRAIAPGDSYVDRSEGSDLGLDALEIGARVRHRKFGEGRIVSIKPTMPPRADVEFPGWGRRTIRADWLEPV
ncbi:MAG: ATP-dependent helicase [Sandaracinaceae bacterium]